jgi:hypothetical protein
MVKTKNGSERDNKKKAREKMAAIRAAMTPEQIDAAKHARKVKNLIQYDLKLKSQSIMIPISKGKRSEKKART